MSRIYQGAPVTNLSGADLFPVYVNSQSYAARTSLTDLLSYFQQNFTSPAFTEQIVVPTEGGTVIVTDNGQSSWVLMQPGGPLTALTIKLPSKSNLSDGQEILVTTTLQISSLSFDTNSVSSIYGEPSSLAAEDKFKLRYSQSTDSWYTVV